MYVVLYQYYLIGGWLFIICNLISETLYANSYWRIGTFSYLSS